ncbi:hypothetical protein V9T40_014494 [Parthenolecanium corni]|uniref:Uncharacterized protein n=1 Tax=Parthenolecanium corni TaxID=536013 RepID=A0AAN9XX28_9HEMI
MSFFKDFIKGERRSPHSDLKSETQQVVEPQPADSGLQMEYEGGATTKEPGAVTITESRETPASAEGAETGAGPETAAGAAGAESATAGAEGAASDKPEGEASGESEGEEMDSAITVAPSMDDSRMTTTSMIMTSSMAPDESTRKRRHISKIDAANEFVYGRSEEPWTKPTGRPSIDMPTSIRINRAQTMRRSCIMKRVKEEAEERSRLEEQDVAWVDNDILDPIVARSVPKAVYGGPKIAIRETKSSKFRFLYNRKPPGVKVYFKPANEDERKKPPFVVAAVNRC